MKKGVHLGSALNPYLFALVMEELTKRGKGEGTLVFDVCGPCSFGRAKYAGVRR